jgi:hypothetical protein
MLCSEFDIGHRSNDGRRMQKASQKVVETLRVVAGSVVEFDRIDWLERSKNSASVGVVARVPKVSAPAPALRRWRVGQMPCRNSASADANGRLDSAASS